MSEGTPGQWRNILAALGVKVVRDKSAAKELPATEGLVNVAERLGYVYGLSVAADMTSATWNTQASHEIATVTGAVRFMIVPICDTGLGSAGAATVCLGIEGTTNQLIADTGFDDIDTDELWLDGTPAKVYADATILKRALNELDIGYEIKTAALNAGNIKFIIFWSPLETGATIVAGAGGAL